MKRRISGRLTAKENCSSISQEEARSISENVTWGHRKRFADGKVSVAYSRFLGYDKGSDYTEWIQSFDGKVKYLVLLGVTKEKIAETARKCGFDNIIMTESLEEAVKVCAENAESGDAVLLSPACASWDMFPSYEVRGRRFKELVRNL